MSKGARNRRIRMFAAQNIHVPLNLSGGWVNNRSVKSLARRIRRSGRKVKLG